MGLPLKLRRLCEVPRFPGSQAWNSQVPRQALSGLLFHCCSPECLLPVGSFAITLKGTYLDVCHCPKLMSSLMCPTLQLCTAFPGTSRSPLCLSCQRCPSDRMSRPLAQPAWQGEQCPRSRWKPSPRVAQWLQRAPFQPFPALVLAPRPCPSSAPKLPASWAVLRKDAPGTELATAPSQF